MAKFVKKPIVVEAITFDELVEYGLKHSDGAIVNGFPWTFKYAGQPISHENDNCYLIPTLEGIMRFERGDMLITGVNGEIYPCKMDIFLKTYDPYVEELSKVDSHEIIKCRRDKFIIVTDTGHCSRCGQDHEKLIFREFKHSDIALFTHWCLCPVTNEPILMLAQQRDEANEQPK
jgi:hypothetical protein